MSNLYDPTLLFKVEHILEQARSPKAYWQIQTRINESYESEAADYERQQRGQAEYGPPVDGVKIKQANVPPLKEIRELQLDVHSLHYAALYRLEDFRRLVMEEPPIEVDFLEYLETKCLTKPKASGSNDGHALHEELNASTSRSEPASIEQRIRHQLPENTEAGHDGIDAEDEAEQGPLKMNTSQQTGQPTATEACGDKSTGQVIKKKRGRPRKNPLPPEGAVIKPRKHARVGKTSSNALSAASTARQEFLNVPIEKADFDRIVLQARPCKRAVRSELPILQDWLRKTSSKGLVSSNTRLADQSAAPEPKPKRPYNRKKPYVKKTKSKPTPQTTKSKSSKVGKLTKKGVKEKAKKTKSTVSEAPAPTGTEKRYTSTGGRWFDGTNLKPGNHMVEVWIGRKSPKGEELVRRKRILAAKRALVAERRVQSQEARARMKAIKAAGKEARDRERLARAQAMEELGLAKVVKKNTPKKPITKLKSSKIAMFKKKGLLDETMEFSDEENYFIDEFACDPHLAFPVNKFGFLDKPPAFF